ncbi:MAG: chemotaxis protein CheW [Clostridiales bacterium]|nr:chemotaxis protein CheW [Eubacteriales bacterium]MDH7567633.1 chemotaxis protein CheW [Clostridiales bacterium]
MAEKHEETLEMEEDTQKGKFLTFSIGKEVYAIEIKFVTEIIGIQPITEVPELPAYVKGIINLRGKIIPVMDVRLRFKKKPMEYNDRTCIIVVEVKGISIGLIVDNVSEVLSIADDDIVPPPDMNKGTENKYIKAIGKVEKEVKLILDCEKLMNDNDVEAISQIA